MWSPDGIVKRWNGGEGGADENIQRWKKCSLNILWNLLSFVLLLRERLTLEWNYGNKCWYVYKMFMKHKLQNFKSNFTVYLPVTVAYSRAYHIQYTINTTTERSASQTSQRSFMVQQHKALASTWIRSTEIEKWQQLKTAKENTKYFRMIITKKQ